uniref:Innexin n=1 Tax=Gongylonema pulchrum TaxID=637853 RepID=A0A183E778_9BILA
LAFEPRRHWYMNFNYSTYDAISIPGTLQRDYRWELVSFWNIYLPSLVQYMTTTFSPFEVKIRRELVAYQMATGVIVCILMVALVLMCLFAYLLFERNSKLSRKEFDCKQLIRNTDGGYPPRHISQTDETLYRLVPTTCKKFGRKAMDALVRFVNSIIWSVVDEASSG